MHEVSVARGIVSIAGARARERGLARVTAVRVRIGAWTCINPDLLRRAFEAAAADTPTEGAQLEIELVPPSCVCTECGANFSPNGFGMKCTACGSPRVKLRQGRELEIDSLEA